MIAAELKINDVVKIVNDPEGYHEYVRIFVNGGTHKLDIQSGFATNMYPTTKVIIIGNTNVQYRSNRWD